MIEFPAQPTRVIIPTHLEPIRTNRLLLRPIDLADAPAIFEFQSRPEVVKWLWSQKGPSSVAETEAKLKGKHFTTADASGAHGRHFYFAVTCLDDPAGRVIGAAGVNALVPAPSIGYGIHPDYWGKGYASEAVAGVVDAWWDLERKGKGDALDGADGDGGEGEAGERLFAACDPANAGSVGVLTRNGFRRYREEIVEGKPVAFFQLERLQRGKHN